MDKKNTNDNDQKKDLKSSIKKFIVIFFFGGSLSLNGVFLLQYIYPGIINHIDNVKGVASVSDYDYNLNHQYNARLTQFQLYDGKTNIVFAGDSITEKGNWSELFSGINCLDRGIGSDTTEGLLNRLDEIMRHEPEKIFILIGINDLSVGVSAEEIGDNMTLIVEKISDISPNCNIYIESILPAKDIDQERIDMVNKFYELICEKNISATYIDISRSFNMPGG